MSIDVTITLAAGYGAADEASARNDVARLLMGVAIAILEGESGDALHQGAWVLALMPDGEVPPTS